MEQLLFNLAFNDKLQIMNNDFRLSFISAVKLEMVQLMKMDMHTPPRIHYEYLAHRLHQFSYDFICPTVMYPYSALAVFNHSIVLYTAVLHRASKTLNIFWDVLTA